MLTIINATYTEVFMFKSKMIQLFAATLLLAPFALQASAAQSTAPATAASSDAKALSEEMSASIFSTIFVGDESLFDVIKGDKVEALKTWPALNTVRSMKDHTGRTILNWAVILNAPQIVGYLTSLPIEVTLAALAKQFANDEDVLDKSADSMSDLGSADEITDLSSAESASDTEGADKSKKAKKGKSALAQKTRAILDSEKDGDRKDRKDDEGSTGTAAK